MKIKLGCIVRHAIHGIGVVTSKWGAWPSCRQCLLELSPSDRECPECKAEVLIDSKCNKCGYLHDVMDDRETCVECGSLLPPKHWIVSGAGIFDVKFKSNGETRSINQCRLTKVDA